MWRVCILLTFGRASGHCLKLEAAFNETAAKFATQPNTPHMALVNCDVETILCNSWSAGTGSVWIFDMLPPPAPIAIYRERMNLTSVTTKDFLALQSKPREDLKPLDSIFHPFDGPIARNGLSIPFAYFIYVFNVVPNWLFMLIISFASRTMMTRRMDNHMNRGDGAAGGAPAPAAG